MVNDNFINNLIGESNDSPPVTNEQKLQESINALAHKMEEKFISFEEQLKNVNTINNESEDNKNEDTKNSESKTGHGQEKPLQNDTIANHDND